MNLAVEDLGDEGSDDGRGCGSDSGSGRAGRGGGRGGGCGFVVGVGDAELGGVLVGAGGIDDELDAVPERVRLEGGEGDPDVGAGVGDFFDNGVEREDVGGGAAEKDEGDSAGGGGLFGFERGLGLGGF